MIELTNLVIIRQFVLPADKKLPGKVVQRHDTHSDAVFNSYSSPDF